MKLKTDIRRRRERLGWSRENLADRLCVTATTVYRWETGRVDPSRAYQRLMDQVFAQAEPNQQEVSK